MRGHAGAAKNTGRAHRTCRSGEDQAGGSRCLRWFGSPTAAGCFRRLPFFPAVFVRYTGVPVVCAGKQWQKKEIFCFFNKIVEIAEKIWYTFIAESEFRKEMMFGFPFAKGQNRPGKEEEPTVRKEEKEGRKGKKPFPHTGTPCAEQTGKNTLSGSGQASFPV